MRSVGAGRACAVACGARGARRIRRTGIVRVVGGGIVARAVAIGAVRRRGAILRGRGIRFLWRTGERRKRAEKIEHILRFFQLAAKRRQISLKTGILRYEIHDEQS